MNQHEMDNYAFGKLLNQYIWYRLTMSDKQRAAEYAECDMPNFIFIHYSLIIKKVQHV